MSLAPQSSTEEESGSIWDSTVDFFRSLSDCCQQDVTKLKYLSKPSHNYNRGEHREIERARSKTKSSSEGKKRTRRDRKEKKYSRSTSTESTATSKSITFEDEISSKDPSKIDKEPFFSNTKTNPTDSDHSTVSTTTFEMSNDGAEEINQGGATKKSRGGLNFGKKLFSRSSTKKKINKNIPTDPSELGDPKGVKWDELTKLMPVSDDYEADFLAVRLQAFEQDELGARSRHSLNTILAYAAIRNDAISIQKILRRLDSFPDIQRDLIMKKNAKGFSALDIAESLKSPLSVILAFRSVPGLESIGNSTSTFS